VTKLLRKIEVEVFGGLRVLHFQTTQDIKRWLDAEEPFWEEMKTKSARRSFGNHWSQQCYFYESTRRRLGEFEKALSEKQEQQALEHNNWLQNHFREINKGTIITSDYDIYPVIVNASKTNLDAVYLLYMMARSDAQQTLGTFTKLGFSFKTLIDLITLQTKGRGTKDWLLPQRREVTALKDEFQAELVAIRAKVEEQNEAIDEQRQHAHKMHLDRESQWSALKEEMELDWESLRKFYDEQLALLAPTQYWSDRAKSHQKTAISFAVAFGVVLAVSVGLFAWLAMPYMFSVAQNKDVSPILTLLPMVIPAFAGVWVLKMLSRLLSENLQMMRDARERETMVKTFLALMRDDRSGQSIINDNDRILILHSLFRPSSVTTVDDAPPVHWFDILTNKVGSKDARR